MGNLKPRGLFAKITGSVMEVKNVKWHSIRCMVKWHVNSVLMHIWIKVGKLFDSDYAYGKSLFHAHKRFEALNENVMLQVIQTTKEI